MSGVKMEASTADFLAEMDKVPHYLVAYFRIKLNVSFQPFPRGNP